ncbi:MAG: hypothetical protein OXI79_01930 [Gammaproteobacteria bacterium]|nr:hypothetical protein [Gammaproteobacteria bacterium]
MKYCIKLLPAFLAFGVFSAYADSETDRYMASAGAPAAEIRENDQQSGVSSQEIVLSGPMSPVTAYYVSPCFGPMCDPEPRKCKWYSFAAAPSSALVPVLALPVSAPAYRTTSATQGQAVAVKAVRSG